MRLPATQGDTTAIVVVLLLAALFLAAIAFRRLLGACRRIRELRAQLAESEAKLTDQLHRAEQEKDSV